MKRILILALIVPLFASANHAVDFPVKVDAQTQHEMNLLVACCEHNASCCVDFSKSTNLEDFKNKVKAIDSYQANRYSDIISRTEETARRAAEIKDRLNKRINSMGNEYYRR